MIEYRFGNCFCHSFVFYCFVMFKLDCIPQDISTDYSKIPFSSKMEIFVTQEGNKSRIIMVCAYIGNKPNDLTVKTKSGKNVDSLDIQLNISRPFIFFSRINFDTTDGAVDVTTNLASMHLDEEFDSKKFLEILEKARYRSTETTQYSLSFEEIKDLSGPPLKFVDFTSSEKVEEFKTEIAEGNLQISVNVDPNKKGENTEFAYFNPRSRISVDLRMPLLLDNEEIFNRIIETFKVEFEEQTTTTQKTPRSYFLFFLLGGSIVLISVTVIIIAFKKNKERRRSRPKVNKINA